MECHLPDAMHCTSTTAPAKSGQFCFLSLILPLHQDWGSCTQQADSTENLDSIPNRKAQPPKVNKTTQTTLGFQFTPQLQKHQFWCKGIAGVGSQQLQPSKDKIGWSSCKTVPETNGFQRILRWYLGVEVQHPLSTLRL